jgi:signal transduction histidine kinase
MRRFRDLPIKWKLMLISVTTGVTALVIAASALFIYGQIAYERQTILRIETLAKVVGDNSTAAITFNDPEVAKRVLSALANDRGILVAGIYDREGRVFAHFSRAEDHRALLPEKPLPEGKTRSLTCIDVSQRIVLEGEIIGSVHIGYSLSPMYAYLARYAVLVGCVLIVAVIASWIVALFLQTHVSRRIVEIRKAAEWISRKQDFSPRLATSGEDEIGSLVHEFNVLLDRINERDASVKIYQEKLRSLASQLVIGEERERRRIADGLHDSICQLLWVADLKLRIMERTLDEGVDIKEFREIEDLIKTANKETRTLTLQLSPPLLYELGLSPALEKLSEDMKDQFRIGVDFTDEYRKAIPSEDTSIFLFRSVREMLMNIYKHAETDRANVTLSEENGSLRVTVSDEGKGFDTTEKVHDHHEGGYGLFSIRERVEDLGGSFDIKSKPGEGTTITLVTPLAKSSFTIPEEDTTDLTAAV